MRHREQGPIVTTETATGSMSYDYYYANGNSNSLSGNQPGTYRSRLTSKVMDDVITAGFAARSAEGEVIINPMLITSTRITAGPVSLTQSGMWGGDPPSDKVVINVNGPFSPADADLVNVQGDGTTDIVAPVAPAVPSTADAISEALIEAHSRVSTHEANLWVTLGELSETYREIIRIYGAVQQLNRILRGKFPEAQLRRLLRKRKRGFPIRWKDLEAAGSYWLEYRYAIRQFWFDTNNYLKAFDSVGKKARQRFTARRTLDPVTNTDPDTAAQIYGIPVPATHYATSGGDVIAGVLTQPLMDEISPFEAVGGHDITRAMWDLVPYSFVVDWFTNVGDWLVAWQPLFHTEKVGSWVTSKTWSKRCAQIDAQDLPVQNFTFGLSSTTGVGSCRVGSVLCEEVITNLERIANPSFAGVFPGITFRMNTSRWVDLAALLNQRISFR